MLLPAPTGYGLCRAVAVEMEIISFGNLATLPTETMYSVQ